jgi:hypothetical protein
MTGMSFEPAVNHRVASGRTGARGVAKYRGTSQGVGVLSGRLGRVDRANVQVSRA